MKSSFFDHNFEELETLLKSQSLNPKAAAQLFNWYYKKKNNALCSQDIAKETLAYICHRFTQFLKQKIER